VVVVEVVAKGYLFLYVESFQGVQVWELFWCRKICMAEGVGVFIEMFCKI
jgi:hypothetical protein